MRTLCAYPAYAVYLKITCRVDGYDSNKCDALLSRGRWLDPPEQQDSVNGYQNWQPAGCMMHEYNARDMTICLKSRRVVFIGDSVTRQIFWALARKLDVGDHGEDKHSSMSVDAHGLKVQFVWDPYLNTSSLHREVAAASPSGSRNEKVDRPAILLMGGGLWNARYLGEASYQHFESSIGEITRALQDGNVPGTPLGLSGQSSGGVEDLVVVYPIQVPHYDALSPERARTITPARVKPIFQHLQQSSIRQDITVAWSFSHMTWREPSAYDKDGLHIKRAIAGKMADVLLNARCNAVLRQSNAKGYPMDKTCCNRYQRPNWIQSVILAVSLGLLPAMILITYKDGKSLNFFHTRKVTRAITVLALAICYCYYADRTQLFNKAQKQFSFKEFMWLCTATLALGVVSIRRSAPASLHINLDCPLQEVQDQPFLSRYQTDEWKGWMQFIILIYHYTGASRILWIYEIVRLLVASYIFMTGFGHTVFFYKRSDYSLRRSAVVLLRLNMLSCILPYAMDTDYLFYYFAPLISFWYLVIYLTMVVGHSRNHSCGFLMAKIMISAILTTALIRVPGIFEAFFQVLEKCFNIHWTVREWRFRLQLDSCIVYTGMLCGTCFVKFIDAPKVEKLEGCAIDRLIRQISWLFRCVSLATAAVTPPIFYLFARRAPDKYAYNAWVPYISTAPILAYVIFRNISRRARNFHSSIFSWMGRHSLETFTLQFHIWLAADTKGLLTIGLFDGIVGGRAGGRIEFAVLTVIFLWICWHVAAATQTLTSWIIDPGEGLRNEELYDGGTGVEKGLPRMKSKEDMRSAFNMSRVADGVGARAITSASRMKRHVAGSLSVRISIILGVMWLLNMTYL